MICEGKRAKALKRQKCREPELKSTVDLKGKINSFVQKSSVAGPSTFSALDMDSCSSKTPSACVGSLQGGSEYSSVNFSSSSATPPGESKNYLGSGKIKTEKENCDDLITNASWGSLAEEVEYVVVRDLAVTSKEKTACRTEGNETFECTATESVTVIRNRSVLENVDELNADHFPVLKPKEFFSSTDEFRELASLEEVEFSDSNLVAHENLTRLGKQSGSVPVRKRQQKAGRSAVLKKGTLQSKAKTFEEVCSDNWSFVTNYESRKSQNSKDTNIAAEFTVQVGDVSIKIQEYSKAMDKVHARDPSCRDLDRPRINEDSSSSSSREKTNGNPDFKEEKDNVIFECPCCLEVLETEEVLLNHVLQSHKTYLCDYCPVPTCSVLLARNKFRIHLRQHLVTGKYQCSFCSFSASMRGAMSRHESTHTKPQVSKDYKNIKKGGSKYRKNRKKRPSKEDSQYCSLDGINAGEGNRGTIALRMTRRVSSEGSQKPLLRRSARTTMPGYKREKAAFMEATKDISEEESEFEGDDNKRETDTALSAAPEGILRFELSETREFKETVLDASTSTFGNSIEPTVEQDIKVEDSSAGDQIFKGLPFNCCSTLLSTVNELVDHVRQRHLAIQRCPSAGIPCIDLNCPVYLKATNLAVHIKSHLVPRKISCNLCTYKTNCEFALRTHTLAHSRIKGMKKKKRVLGARRCALKHRLRLRSQALPEEKTNTNDISTRSLIRNSQDKQ
ncbi:transcription factor E4F1-like [Macrobrachium nipponense]|uniref:transcription factor E4F1-like n=1 Tax=Macrobrachium nipponense TaxID=159736 RepID=UPI0030C898BA